MALRNLHRMTMEMLRPPPRLNVREWADANRWLSRESSSKPGKYESCARPYQAEPQESVTADAVSQVVLMFASQLGKTEIVNNICGFFMDADPAPILVVQPTIERAEEWSKERFAPMIRDCPALRDKVKSPRSRDSGNTVLTKNFPGGNIAIAGANAPSGLAARPRRVVLLDEIDRFPLSAGTEGDPCALAERRTEDFFNAIIVKTSTPTVKGQSRIEAEFLETDQCKWFCPCPKCGKHQVLMWGQVKWPEDEPELARYECEHCRQQLTDDERRAMVMDGEWRATAPFKGRRGYWLNGINNVSKHKKGFRNRLHQMADGFVIAKRGGKHKLRTWVNTFLAETFADETEKVEPNSLLGRREGYTAPPASVLVITAGADVQADRVEIEIVGWGVSEESWALQYVVVPGRYEDPKTWEEVDRVLSQKFDREDGLSLGVSAAIIDSGAFQDHVLKFTRTRFVRHIIAGKGVNAAGHPVLSTVSRSNKLRAPQYRLGTDTAKGIIVGRLKQAEHGPGFMHYPSEVSAGFGREYFNQLTAEEFRTVWRKGALHREWVKDSGRRNEALDCRVYGLAALYHLNPNWSKLAKNLARRAVLPIVPTTSDIECPTNEPAGPGIQPAEAATAPTGGEGDPAKKKLVVRRSGIRGIMRFRPY